MKGIVRDGDKTTKGNINITCSPSVFMNGRGVFRVGDEWETGEQETGSTTVFANGKAIARIDDQITDGSQNETGS